MRSSATPPTRITCLVRELEIFLETFHHDTPTPSGIELRPLSICVDGSDFTLPKDFPSEDPGAELPAIVEAYLAASRYLLVVSSRGARASVWVRKEVEWFLAHRLPGQVLLAVSQGDDPAEAPDEVFPEPIVNAGLHRRLWYDLRGYRRQEGQQWRKVRDFDDNRVRLAAGLQGVHVRDVQPSWFRAKQKAKQEERARRRVAASKKLALTAQSLIPRQLDLALLLSVAALDLSDTVEARNALLAGLERQPCLQVFLHGHEADVVGTAFLPGGRRLVSAGSDRLLLWDVASAKIVADHTLAGGSGSPRIAVNPDGKQIAV